jgi:uncharacterized membrane protein
MARKKENSMKDDKEINTLTDFINIERLIFLVDGIFAITLTLLVLDLRPPEAEASKLAEGLLGMLPRLLVYLIAFYTIANHWTIHQRTFRHITDVDATMLWLTLMSLLLITLIPASTALIGHYPDQSLAVACFSANSFLHALTNWIFWAYVQKHHRQFASSSDLRMLGVTSQVWFVITLGWFVSIFFSFVNIYVAYVSWILWPNLVAAWGNRKRHQLIR